MSESQNDNDVALPAFEPSRPDAHGQAALLLVESLLHGLIERSVITVADAVDFVKAAADVRQEIGYDRQETLETMETSLTILRSIASSLRLDRNNESIKSVD